MKKRFLTLLLALLLAALLPTAALAEETGAVETAPVETEAAETEEVGSEAAEAEPAQVFPYVLDNAGLLSAGQLEALLSKAAELSEAWRCSLYVVTVQDHTVFNYDVYEAAKGIFTHYDLGLGEERDGVLLLLSMDERDYALIGHGGRGETVCGSESSWLIEDAFLDDLGRNDWYGGFSDYLDACAEQLRRLDAGEDINAGADIITGPDGLDYHSYNNPYGPRRSSTPLKIAAVVGIPLVVALIVCSVFKAQMKTAREATRADAYLVPRSMNLRVKQDRFLRRSETRTLIESDSGSRGSSGGGSSFHSGGGFSGRSGKF